jgi:nitrite reductase (NADH) small subunit
MAFIRIADLSAVPPGNLREIQAADRTFAVCNVGGEIRVFDGICPCAGGPVGQGKMFDGVLVCPWHGMRYDVETGKCTLGKDLAIARYQVRIDGDAIWVELEGS